MATLINTAKLILGLEDDIRYTNQSKKKGLRGFVKGPKINDQCMKTVHPDVYLKRKSIWATVKNTACILEPRIENNEQTPHFKLLN